VAIVNSKYIPAKLFLGLTLLCFAVGVALFRPGLPVDFYLNPLTMLLLPRLIPFSLAIISAVFGLICLIIERNFNRRVSIPLILVQITLLLLAAFCQNVIVRFWWQVLGDQQTTNPPIPLWSVMLGASALVLSFVIFLLNIFSAKQPALRKA
jgi:hypothetical protein